MTKVVVHTYAGATAPKVGGEHDGCLIVRVRERTVKGAATEAVRHALAEALGVSSRNVTVVSGETTKRKVLEVDNRLVDVAARVAELMREGP